MGTFNVWLRDRFKTIVLATDLDEASKLPLEYAVEIARLYGSKLTVLNVFEFGPHSQAVELLDRLPSRERKDAEGVLRSFLSESGHAEVNSEVSVDETFVTSAIVKVLSEKSIKMLVMSTKGIHRGADHLFFGSKTEALMLASPCMTLTIGPHVPNSNPKQIRTHKIIYVSDFTVASTAAASYALALASTLGAELSIYQLASKSAVKDAARLRQMAEQYCDMLHFTNPDLPAEWYDPEFQLSRIVPEEELLAVVSEHSNLILLGVQPASFLQRHLHASIAYRLLANAASPVLTVPANASARTILSTSDV